MFSVIRPGFPTFSDISKMLIKLYFLYLTHSCLTTAILARPRSILIEKWLKIASELFVCILLANKAISSAVSRKLKISKNRTFFKMAVTFDLNKIFQFCFNILKDNRKIFNINSGFFMNTNIYPKMARQK